MRTVYFGLNVVHGSSCHVLNHFPLYPHALFNHSCEHIRQHRLHQEQSHLQQQDAPQDVPDTVGKLDELSHCKHLGSTVYSYGKNAFHLSGDP